MKKQEKIAYVQSKIAYWLSYVTLSNHQSFTDINRISEGFLMNLLNKIFNYNLVNLNESANNFPGVDLGDIDSRIAFQVTSEKTSEKIIDTYSKIYKHSYKGKLIGDIFSTKIYFFIITESWNPNFAKSTIEKINKMSHNRFVNEDIITVNDLIKSIVELYDKDVNKFNEIYKLVSDNIDDLPPLKTDDVILENLLLYFDRPAFTTPFYMESNLPNFEQALIETIQVINTGLTPKNGEKIECKNDVSDPETKIQLDNIVNDLIKLRYTYERLLKSKEIQRCTCNDPSCGVHILSETACREMDSSRAALLSKVNALYPNFKIRICDF